MYPRVILALLCIVMLLGVTCGCSAGTAEEALSEEPEAAGEAGYRRTVLYYMTDEGLIAPVVKLIPWEEGIGKAALACMVDTAENRAAASMRGLVPVIPDGTEYTLRIGDDGAATVDIIGLCTLADAAKEEAMVMAIVNTLTEFESISTVDITIDGKRAEQLPHGTNIGRTMSAFALNAEESELSVNTDGASAVTLYFPNSAASLYVPVTRYTELTPGVENTVHALMDGPKHAGLLAMFPEETVLLSASVEDNAATLDFSAELASVNDTEGLSRALYEAVFLTLKEAHGIDELEVLVEGRQLFESADTPVSAPLYANEFALERD